MKLVDPSPPIRFPRARPSERSRPPTGCCCALRASSRRPAARGRCACFPAAPNSSRNISRWCATRARAASRSRSSTGAGRGSRSARCRMRARATCYDFSEYDRDLEAFVKEIVLPDCPPPLFALGHSMGAAVLIRSVQHGRRWFDRIVLSGTDDQARARGRDALRAGRRARFLRLVGMGSSLRAGRRRHADQHAAVCRQQAHLRSGALCAHRRDHRGRARARDRLADGRLGRFGLPGDERIRRSKATQAACASRCCWSRPDRTRSSRRRRSARSRCGCARARIW